MIICGKVVCHDEVFSQEEEANSHQLQAKIISSPHQEKLLFVFSPVSICCSVSICCQESADTTIHKQRKKEIKTHKIVVQNFCFIRHLATSKKGS